MCCVCPASVVITSYFARNSAFFMNVPGMQCYNTGCCWCCAWMQFDQRFEYGSLLKKSHVP